MTCLSSFSSTKPGTDRSISVLPLLLPSTIIPATPITEHEESTFKRNNRVRIQIGLAPLTHDTTILSAVDYVGASFSIPVDITTVEIRGDETANLNDDETTI